MKELLKRYKYAMLIVAIPYILFILMLVIPTKKSITLPGNIVNVNGVIRVENGYNQQGSFNTTFVTSTENLTLFQLSLCQNLEEAYIYDYSDNYNYADDTLLNKINKNASITNSIISAYRTAGENISYSFKGIVVTSALEESSFKVGDIILGNSRQEIINNLEKIKAQGGDIKIIRSKSKNEEMTITPKIIDGKLGIGINNRSYYDIYDYSCEKKVNVYQATTIGPSGGLMQALSVYNGLTEFDYTRGLKIAGTGTIDISGNVGVIGGIKQKVYTAAKQKCDIFFTPDGDENSYEHQNFLDAAEVIDEANEKSNSKMKIVPVKNLEEALEYLRGYEN